MGWNGCSGEVFKPVTVSGPVCTFNSQYALPLKSHKVALTAIQSGSGTPSPSNPRPISGYSAINISQSGADTSNPTVYTIQIGSTVYGGEYDARTGVFTATHGSFAIGDKNWGYTNTRFYVSVADIPNYDPTVEADIICECYRPFRYTSQTDLSVASYYKYVYIRDDSFSGNISDFKTAMGTCKIVYKLDTPFTIQLPPCPIDTLEGVNNIWADTGDTTLQYMRVGR